MKELFIVLLLLVSGVLLAESPADAIDPFSLPYEERPVLMWGILPDYLPNMAYDEKTQKGDGFLFDLLDYTMEDLGIPNELKSETFSNIYEELLHGSLHMFPALLRTPEREEVIYWPNPAEPTITGWGSVFVKLGSPHMTDSILGLKDQTIGALRGDGVAAQFLVFMGELGVSVKMEYFGTFTELLYAITNNDIYAGVALNSLLLNAPGIDQTPIIFTPMSSYATGGLDSPAYAKVYIDAIAKQIKIYKNEEGGIYHDLQDKWLLVERIETNIIPSWILLAFAALFGVILATWILLRILTRKLRIANNTQLQFNSQLEESLQEKAVELERASLQMIQAEKMSTLGEAASGIAHEVNTPLGVAYTGITLLISKIESTRKLFDNVEMTQSDLIRFFEESDSSAKLIEFNLKRSAELIKRFKQVSVDSIIDPMRDINLPSYILEIWESIKPKYKSLHKTITFDAWCEDENGNQIKVAANTRPGILAQIVVNFIDNAIDHGFEGHTEGHMNMSFKFIGGKTHVRFENTGNSIDESLIPKMLEPFYTSKLDKGHSGMGLPIVYRVLQETWNLSYWNISSRTGGGMIIDYIVEEKTEEEKAKLEII